MSLSPELPSIGGTGSSRLDHLSRENRALNTWNSPVVVGRDRSPGGTRVEAFDEVTLDEAGPFANSPPVDDLFGSAPQVGGDDDHEFSRVPSFRASSDDPPYYPPSAEGSRSYSRHEGQGLAREEEFAPRKGMPEQFIRSGQASVRPPFAASQSPVPSQLYHTPSLYQEVFVKDTGLMWDGGNGPGAGMPGHHPPAQQPVPHARGGALSPEEGEEQVTQVTEASDLFGSAGDGADSFGGPGVAGVAAPSDLREDTTLFGGQGSGSGNGPGAQADDAFGMSSHFAGGDEGEEAFATSSLGAFDSYAHAGGAMASDLSHSHPPASRSTSANSTSREYFSRGPVAEGSSRAGSAQSGIRSPASDYFRGPHERTPMSSKTSAFGGSTGSSSPVTEFAAAMPHHNHGGSLTFSPPHPSTPEGSNRSLRVNSPNSTLRSSPGVSVQAVSPTPASSSAPQSPVADTYTATRIVTPSPGFHAPRGGAGPGEGAEDSLFAHSQGDDFFSTSPPPVEDGPGGAGRDHTGATPVTHDTGDLFGGGQGSHLFGAPPPGTRSRGHTPIVPVEVGEASALFGGAVDDGSADRAVELRQCDSPGFGPSTGAGELSHDG
jgi:hypothetical protein